MRQCPPEENLELFLAQELNGAASRALEQHLADCPTCQNRLHLLTDEPLEDTWKRQQHGSSSEFSLADSVVVEELSDRLAQALKDEPSTIAVRHRGARARDDNKLPELAGYEMLRVLAHGGMAVVYLAHQQRPSRHVAIKFISTGVSEHGKPTDRLFAEADALARLHHPNIVEIFEVGQHEGQPYLVLEYLPGGTLDDMVRGSPLPFSRVASLIETLAEAMEAAHRAGLVHRDLKPSNILLTADGTPKIGDFGLVKELRSDNGLTTAGAVLGTPSYMAPEQAGGTNSEITAATDVYALGALLYALVTGRPPFKAASSMETVLQVLHEEPPTPWLLRPELPRDLQTICMHCLEKDPKRRYSSAAELAADLRHFRQGEPIAARPVGAFGKTIKWARRRPAVAGLLAVLCLGTAVSLVVMTWLWDQAETRARTEKEARELASQSERGEKLARQDLERLSASLALDQAQSLCDDGDVGRGLISFVRALELAVRAQDTAGERAARLSLTAWRRHFVGRPRNLWHPSWVMGASFSPDEKTLLTLCHDDTVRFWNVATGMLQGDPLRSDTRVVDAAYSPDGKQVLTSTGSLQRDWGAVRVWDAATHELITTLPHPDRVISVSFSSKGDSFLSVCSKQAQIWGRDSKPIGPPIGPPNAKLTVATYSPDGKTIATGGTDGIAQLWNAADGKAIGKPMRHVKSVLGIVFHPSSRSLVTATENDNSVQLWDLEKFEAVGQPLMHCGPVKTMTFSADGRRLAVGAAIFAFDPSGQRPLLAGGEVRLWQATSGKLLRMPLQHPMPVWSLAFNPSGDRLLTGSEDGIARLFDCNTGQPISNILLSSGTIMDVAITRNGLTAAAASAGSSARLWDLTALQDMGQGFLDDQAVRSVAFSPDSQVLAAGCEDGTVRLWNRAKQRLEPFTGKHAGQIGSLAWSKDGKSLLSGADDKFARLWEYPSGRLLREHATSGKVYAAALLPEGQGFLTGHQGGGINRWDVFGNSVGNRLDTRKTSVVSLAITPDGRSVWVAVPLPVLWRFELATGKVTQTIEHNGDASVLAMSPDGRTLLIGQRYKSEAQLWDLTVGRPKRPPMLLNGGGVTAASFSPDSRLLLICGGDGPRLWDVETGKPIGPVMPEPKFLSGAISPDGQTVVTGGKYGARFWAAPSPLTGTVETVRLEFEILTGFELDRDGNIRETDTAAIKLR